jgi:hypothetical protein
MCGTLLFLALQTGNNDEGNPTSLPAYGDASSVAITWQETPECDIPARPSDSFQTLFAMSAGDITPTPPPDEVGTAADIATVAAIEALVRELVACHNAGQPGRYYALWTNTAILWTNRIMSEPKPSSSWLQSVWQAAEAAEAADGTPEPGEPVEIWTVQGVNDITVLSDGRVRATVRYETPRGEFAVLTHFDQRDGQFLLDAAAGWTYGGGAALYPWTNLLATPAPAAESGSGGTTVTPGDTGADGLPRPFPYDGGEARRGRAIYGDPFWPTRTGDSSSIGQDPIVPIESENPGDTSAGVAVGGATGGTMTSEPTPTSPAVNINSGNTSGGTALGGAGGYLLVIVADPAIGGLG